MNKNIFAVLTLVLLVASCGNLRKQTTDESASLQPVGPVFCADSAYQYCQSQCDFGPRTMNSKAHDNCEQWIVNKFKVFGMEVVQQKAVLKGYEGTSLNSTNIIASYHPELKDRILLCAHWDSRPWADNDPDESNWKTPVMAANDGASGVGVMLEIARLLSADTLRLGVDFICFDAEDWKARFGILLDMVGGQGAQFYKEGMSVQYANSVVDKVWRAAQVVGYGSMFPTQLGPGITDDHLPVNTKAKIPTIDIIPYYPNCEQSGFGPTWHTVNDDMAHLDKNTLQAVGQTLIQVIFSEK